MQEQVKTIERKSEDRNASLADEVATLRAELQESERARRRAEGSYRSLYENSQDLFVSVDLATDAIVLCNRTLEVKIGVPRDRLVGSSVLELFSRSSQRRVRRLLSHSEHTVPRDTISVVLLTRTAAEIPAQLTVRYESDPGGIRHAHCTLRDLSDVRKTRALEQLTERLERSNEDLERFALVASHDLLEPLRAIKGFVGILESRISSRLDSEDRVYLERTLEGADRMERLIDGLLSVAKVNHHPIDAKPVELNRTLEHVSSVFSERLNACGGRVDAEPLPQVLGDAAQLELVFQNLIGNALRYRSARPLRIRIGREEFDDRWLLSFSDNGIGFPQVRAEELFAVASDWRLYNELSSATAVESGPKGSKISGLRFFSSSRNSAIPIS